MLRIQPLAFLLSKLAVRATRLGRESSAIRLAAIYARLRPDRPNSWTLRAGPLISFGRLSEAERVLREGLRRHPDSIVIGDHLAWLLLRRAREEDHLEGIEEATQIFLRLSAASSKSPIPHLGLAAIARGKADWDEVRRHAAAAEALIGTDSDVYTTTSLGIEYFFVPGERDRSLVLLRTAADLGDADANLILAAALEKTDPDEAQERLVRGRQGWIGPRDDFPEAFKRYQEAYG